MPDTPVTDAVQAGNQTIALLQQNLAQAETAEAQALKERQDAAARVHDLTQQLAQARADEQRAIHRLGVASENRRQWAQRVTDVKNQLDKIELELRNLQKLTQPAS